MPINLKFRSWLEYEIECLFANNYSYPKALPDNTKFYAILCNNSALTDLSTKAEVISSEIAHTTTNNYIRYNANFQNESIYDSTNKRLQMPVATWTFASPSQILYNSVILLADSQPQTNKSVTVASGSPGTFTVPSHALGNDEEVVFTADSSGGMPAELSSSKIYYTQVIDGDNFNVTEGAVGASTRPLIEITSAGSNVRMRYAKGRLVGIFKEDSEQTLPPNVPRSWNIFIANAAGFGIGEGS